MKNLLWQISGNDICKNKCGKIRVPEQVEENKHSKYASFDIYLFY